MQLSLSAQRHRYIFIFGLLLLVVGLACGRALISIAESLIFLNWIWERNFKWKIQKIKESKIFWIAFGFFLLHAIGLFWSSNLSYAIKDLWVKAPLLEFPLIFVTTAFLEKRELKLVLTVFVLAIIGATLWSMVFYFGWRPLENGDYRKISRFDSHIRLSLKILLSIFISIWFLRQKESHFKKFLWILAFGWLLFFLFILSSLNGIVILGLIMVYYFFVALFRMRSTLIRYFIIFSFLFIGIFSFFKVKREFNDFFKVKESVFEKVEHWTPTNDLYYHESSLARENGYFVWRYVAYPELKRGWNKLSSYKFDSLDRKGNKVAFTLIRYITSMGLRKDTFGIQKLNRKDIENIESGIPNYKLGGASPIKLRLYEMFWEIDDYVKNGNVAGHSIMMKVEFWRTGLRIAKKNFLIGVGTGDIQDAFTQEYISENSKLKNETDRRRAHNQFIEITATLGIGGVFLLLAMLFYPFKKPKELHLLYLPFFLISFIGFFSEDSLETQMGATFFAFFYSLFVFGIKREKLENE